jgi:3-hydroxybutyrate dehydrogenase
VRDFPEERWDALVAVLMTSSFLLAKYAWDALAASGDGRFLAVASVHGLVASPFKAGYVAAKHGVIGLVKVLALEGADVGISAAALCPAYVRTGIVERQLEERSVEDLLAPQAVKRMPERGCGGHRLDPRARRPGGDGHPVHARPRLDGPLRRLGSQKPEKTVCLPSER